MEQMADETTLRADVKDKGRINNAEEGSTWARGERIQSEAHIGDWRLGGPPEAEPGETSRETDTKRPRECDSSPSPLFSLKMYLRRASHTTDSSLSSSQQSNNGVDCAGMVLSCLFCRFYDLFHMLPDPCEKLANHCCPSYRHIVTTTESTPGSNEDDSCIDLDCGLFDSCHDAGDCLEIAMEVSELCYR